MASPVDSARVATNITTAATSHAVNVGSPVAGTLLIVFARFAAAPGAVTFTGYTLLGSLDATDASDDSTGVYYRWADGTEGATDVCAPTNSVKAAYLCWEITGAEDPAIQAPEISTVAIGTTSANTANPGSRVVSGSGLAVSQEVTDTTPFNIGGFASSLFIAQSWTQVGAGTLSSVEVFLGTDIGTPTDDVILSVRADTAGSPSTSITDSVTVASGSLTANAWNTFTLTGGAQLTDGALYWIVLSRSGSIDVSNYRRVNSASSGFPYAGGSPKSTSNGTTWVGAGTLDMSFRINMSVKDALFLALAGQDGEVGAYTAAPTNYTNLATANSGTGGAASSNCYMGGASRQLTATSDDPGVFTHGAATTGWTAFTVAVHPPPPPVVGLPLVGMALGQGYN